MAMGNSQTTTDTTKNGALNNRSPSLPATYPNANDKRTIIATDNVVAPFHHRVRGQGVWLGESEYDEPTLDEDDGLMERGPMERQVQNFEYGNLLGEGHAESASFMSSNSCCSSPSQHHLRDDRHHHRYQHQQCQAYRVPDAQFNGHVWKRCHINTHPNTCSVDHNQNQRHQPHIPPCCNKICNGNRHDTNPIVDRCNCECANGENMNHNRHWGNDTDILNYERVTRNNQQRRTKDTYTHDKGDYISRRTLLPSEYHKRQVLPCAVIQPIARSNEDNSKKDIDEIESFEDEEEIIAQHILEITERNKKEAGQFSKTFANPDKIGMNYGMRSTISNSSKGIQCEEKESSEKRTFSGCLSNDVTSKAIIERVNYEEVHQIPQNSKYDEINANETTGLHNKKPEHLLSNCQIWSQQIYTNNFNNEHEDLDTDIDNKVSDVACPNIPNEYNITTLEQNAQRYNSTTCSHNGKYCGIPSIVSDTATIGQTSLRDNSLINSLPPSCVEKGWTSPYYMKPVDSAGSVMARTYHSSDQNNDLSSDEPNNCDCSQCISHSTCSTVATIGQHSLQSDAMFPSGISNDCSCCINNSINSAAATIGQVSLQSSCVSSLDHGKHLSYSRCSDVNDSINSAAATIGQVSLQSSCASSLDHGKHLSYSRCSDVNDSINSKHGATATIGQNCLESGGVYHSEKYCNCCQCIGVGQDRDSMSSFESNKARVSPTKTQNKPVSVTSAQVISTDKPEAASTSSKSASDVKSMWPTWDTVNTKDLPGNKAPASTVENPVSETSAQVISTGNTEAAPTSSKSALDIKSTWPTWDTVNTKDLPDSKAPASTVEKPVSETSTQAISTGNTKAVSTSSKSALDIESTWPTWDTVDTKDLPDSKAPACTANHEEQKRTKKNTCIAPVNEMSRSNSYSVAVRPKQQRPRDPPEDKREQSSDGSEKHKQSKGRKNDQTIRSETDERAQEPRKNDSAEPPSNDPTQKCEVAGAPVRRILLPDYLKPDWTKPTADKILSIEDNPKTGKAYYHAYLCVAEMDADGFGWSFHKLLTDWGFRIFMPDFHLLSSGWKYEDICAALEERCNGGKIIIVLSVNYEGSEECQFITQYAKGLDLVSQKRNLIPVEIDKNFNRPRVLEGLATIKYNRDTRNGWLKKKMIDAILA